MTQMGFEHTILAGERPQTYALDNTATRYRLEGPGIEFRGRRDFPQSFRPALGHTQPAIQWVPGHSRGYSGQGVALTTLPIQRRG